MRLRRPVLGATAALLLAGCGPSHSISVSLRNFASSLTYGGSPPPPPPPIAAANPTPTFPSFIEPPVVVSPPTPVAPATTVAPPPPVPAAPRPSRPAAAPAPVCPAAAPNSFPAVSAGAHVLAPPIPGSYVYRQTGSYSIDGKTGKPAAHTLRIITNVTPSNNGVFTFDVDEADGSDITDTTYQVNQSTSNSATDGIFITQVVTRHGDGTIDQFAPEPAIRIMPLPADNTQMQFSSAGADALHGTTEEISGEIVGHHNVDACGTVLDSWEVHVTGQLISTTENLAIDATYDIGTQFGGLSLSDSVHLSGTDAGGSVDQRTTATIDSSPVASGQAG
jgi:hypothetical protein